MSAINETLVYVIDNTISCNTSIEGLLIRSLALYGLIAVGMSTLTGLAWGFLRTFSYIYGFFKWIYFRIRGKVV